MPKFRPTRLLALTALLATTAQAQMHHVDAPENVTRSIGVYEWTGDLAKPAAARLIPVSLFIDGGFRDGGTYYARPVPLALDSGNIYFLEKAGVPQGTITLDYARHLQAAAGGADDSTNIGWFGYGTFATMPVPRKTPALHVSANPSAIVSSKDDDRPTFVRRATDDSKTAGAPDTDDDKKPTKKTAAPAASVTPPPAGDDDPDRPHFSKPPATTTSDQTPATTSTPSTPTPAQTSDNSTTAPATKDPDDDKDRPTLRHRDPKQAEADRKARAHGSVSAMKGSLNDDPDRPNMRRGKTAGIGGDPAPQLSGMPKDLHQMVVVSDPANREPHPFLREWATPTERADVLSKLEAIAQTQLAAYVQRNFSPATAPAASTKTKAGTATARTHRTSPAKPAPAPPAAPLSGEELTGYTLSYGGLPTFVYTALSEPAEAASGLTNPERYVTVVAQQLPSGELQVAFSSVTDAAHLDRTPWFRLVDAVDPDASHRASLLFELRGHSSRQFALYRVISAKADQIFATSPTD